MVTNNIYTQSVLTFDGQDDYISFGRNDIGGVFAEGSSAFTVSGWINPYQLTDKASSYGTRNVFFARSSDRYSDNFEFGISEDGKLDVYIDEKVSKVIKTFGEGELTIGQWHFFAIVFNKGQLTIYLDDREYFGYFTGDSLNKATSPVTLGATLHNNIYFTGQLANISVWNYPCPPVEIHNHRDRPLMGNEQGLVAYWQLNEGEGATVKDQTENAHNGTLYGDPNWDTAQIPFGIRQSSNEGETQDQIASNSEEGNPAETVVLELESESITSEVTQVEIELQQESVAEVTQGKIELQQASVEVPPVVETVVPTETTTVKPKGKKGTKKQSEKSTNTPTSQPKEEKAETTKNKVTANIQQQEKPQKLTQEESQKNHECQS